MSAAPALASWFRPTTVGPLALPTRVVMAPMTRNRSPLGVPGEDVAAYYGRRAAELVGLVITEGVVVDHPAANGYRDVPSLAPSTPTEALARIPAAVHAHGGKVVPQLWHVGSIRKLGRDPDPSVPGFGPSPVPHPAYGPNGPVPHAMTDADVADVIDAFARGAARAVEAGFDGVELHGAHGYLLDQFGWSKTNQRTDGFGLHGGFVSRFHAALVRAVRAALPPDRALIYRFSQWKLGAYDEVAYPDVGALEAFLGPLVDAGVDILHPSTRRMMAPAFAGSTETLAGVTRRLVGKPVIGVGSVGIDLDITKTTAGVTTHHVPLDEVAERVALEGIDLVGVGRALLVEPRWARLALEGRLDEAEPYEKSKEDVYR